MGSEDYEVFKAMRDETRDRRRGNRELADQQFADAGDLARRHGLLLRKCTEQHYQLRPVDRSWLIDVWPGNQRVKVDINVGQAPWLSLPKNWDLLTLVAVAAEIPAVDVCGLCGEPGADKVPHPIRWPGERDPGSEFVHAACEDAESIRARGELSEEEEARFLHGIIRETR